MSDAAVRLGATLGLFMRYGRDTVTEALAACRDGKATPRQQMIVFELVDALT